MLVNESNNKGITINRKKTESMVVSKRDRPKCVLHIGDVKTKQIHKYNY